LCIFKGFVFIQKLHAYSLALGLDIQQNMHLSGTDDEKDDDDDDDNGDSDDVDDDVL